MYFEAGPPKGFPMRGAGAEVRSEDKNRGVVSVSILVQTERQGTSSARASGEKGRCLSASACQQGVLAGGEEEKLSKGA